MTQQALHHLGPDHAAQQADGGGYLELSTFRTFR
jgi:hypothetical protein